MVLSEIIFYLLQDGCRCLRLPGELFQSNCEGGVGVLFWDPYMRDPTILAAW